MNHRRFNFVVVVVVGNRLFKTVGFESDVGSKTTHWVLSTIKDPNQFDEERERERERENNSKLEEITAARVQRSVLSTFIE